MKSVSALLRWHGVMNDRGARCNTVLAAKGDAAEPAANSFRKTASSALSANGTERSSANGWPVRHRCGEIAVIDHAVPATPLFGTVDFVHRRHAAALSTI